jgi:hypothetical protein
MARTPPEAVIAAAREHGLRLYLGRHAQRLTVVSCLLEGFVAAGLLLALLLTIVNAAAAGGVPLVPVIAFGVVVIALTVHATLMARHRVYYLFAEGIVSTNLLGRPTVSGRWASLSVRQKSEPMYVSGGYLHTLVHYEVVDVARNRLRITLQRGSETDMVLQALLASEKSHPR